MNVESGKQFSFHFEQEPTGGIRSGANDGRLHQFTGQSAASSVVREAIQNSLDAKRDDADRVTVEFELRDIQTSKIPGIEGLRRAAKSAWEFNKGNAGSESLREASSVLTQETISVLRIGDYGTTGLEGDELEPDEGTPSPLVALVLGDGLSSKKDGQGGSFGIGASAMLRASRTRTVAYLTQRADGSSIFASRSLLARHRDQNGTIRRKDGIFRADTGEFNRSIESVGSFSRREVPGTDIFVYGYQEESLLQGIQEAVISNFMAAVYFGQLEVRIMTSESMLEITVDNIGTIISQTADNGEHWVEFYNLLANTEPITGNLPALGEVKLYLEAREDKKYGVQLMRKPLMLVKTFKPRGLSLSYIGIFICENDKGNAILQAMEPPSHNEWERSGDRGNATVRNQVDTFIKDQIKALLPESQSEEMDLKGLEDLLPQQLNPQTRMRNLNAIIGGSLTRSEKSNSSVIMAPGKEIKNIRITNNSNNPRSAINREAISHPDGDESVHRGEHDGPEKPTPENRSPDKTIPDKGEPGEGSSLIKLADIEWKSFNPSGTNETVIVINPIRDTQGDIALKVVGADQTYDAEIARASIQDDKTVRTLEHTRNRIKAIELNESQLVRLHVQFVTGSNYVLEIVGE